MNMKIALVFSATVFAAGISAFAVTEGWDNINPSRTNLPPQKVYWMADLDSAKLELREGAEGLIRVVEESGKKKLVIVKKGAGNASATAKKGDKPRGNKNFGSSDGMMYNPFAALLKK